MPKAEFVQLAQAFDTKKHGVGGWWWSEKLDGQRAFWDGGVSRGVKKKYVPWANTSKDHRYKVEPTATGLWSRYGNVISAPDWFLDKLPRMLLDGELWSKLYRQDIASIIKKLTPNSIEWEKIQFHVFDIPAAGEIFKSRKISGTNFTKYINSVECQDFYGSYYNSLFWVASSTTTLRQAYFKISEIENYFLARVTQFELDYSTTLAEKQLQVQLERVVEHGGEGLIIRNPESCWRAVRTHSMLKYKKLDDAEGILIGYVSGRETDLGSKHLGKIGALVILYKGQRLELSGLTDEERELSDSTWAETNPGKEVPNHIEAKHFERGQSISFKYRGLSKTGIPQEARYWRKDANLY